MTLTTGLPRWDLNPIFPGLESEPFKQAWASLEAQLAELQQFFAKHEIAKREPRESDKAIFHALKDRLNRFSDTLGPLRAYLLMLVDVDTSNAVAQAKLSELEVFYLEYRKLQPRLTAWLAILDAQVVEAGEYKIVIEEARVKAQHQMSEAEEVLAAELSLSGSRAWVKLYSNLTSQITAVVNGEELPIAAVRNLATDPDQAVRKAAYEAELKAWKANEVAIAAALNGYKGQVATLNRKRGWEGDLAPALHLNRITHKTLEAMQAATVGSFPYWRRYFRAKAKSLGKARLDWWDLFAPVRHSHTRWSWEEGRQFIVRHLEGFSKADAGLAQRAYAERWIDAPPMKGKVSGAYCTPILNGVSRILVNYQESFEWVSTMAHELGHAYHNYCLRDVPALLRHEPMTLAETASIMNETIVGEAALKVLPPADQLVVLEGGLQSAAQIIVDIHSRFVFESGIFAKRKERELSPDEFSELMLLAQQQTYGDGLVSYHPYMWAAKGHYYGSNFYNFPYAFGLLFGLALYSQYLREGPGFVQRYDRLLASVGMFSAEELAAQYGFDLQSQAFWQGGIDVLLARIDQFEKLTG